MIQTLKSTIVLAALSLLPHVALSQDSTPRQVRVQVEFIEMSHEELTNLMIKPRTGETLQ